LPTLVLNGGIVPYHVGHLLLRLGLVHHLHDEGEQLFERLKARGLVRHQVLDPTLPLPLLDFRVGMKLHHKSPLSG